jgi:hypothetical protein
MGFETQTSSVANPSPVKNVKATKENEMVFQKQRA